MSFDPQLIKWSFSVVERRADQLSAFFYAHLFRHNPGIRQMFPERMDEQRDRLFAALTTAATHAEDTDTLVAYLRDLGFDHRKFGARPEHYPAVGASLIATLKYFAGSAWTPEIEASWAAAYGVISDVMIAAAEEVPESTPRWWDGEVVAHERHTEEIAVLTVLPQQPYPFQAGQYATLCVPEVPRVWRPYSIANAPRPDGTLEFHVRRVPEGQVSTALVDRLHVGSTLRLGPALGSMTLPPELGEDLDLLCVAGGTGWAPVKALIEAAMARPGLRSVRILLGAAGPEHVYDIAALERLVALGARLDLAVAPPSQHSVPDRSGVELLRELDRLGEEFAQLEAPVEWPHSYVSGPPGMVEAVRARLEAVPHAEPKRIHSDPVISWLVPERRTTAAEFFLQDREVPWIRPR